MTTRRRCHPSSMPNDASAVIFAHPEPELGKIYAQQQPIDDCVFSHSIQIAATRSSQWRWLIALACATWASRLVSILYDHWSMIEHRKYQSYWQTTIRISYPNGGVGWVDRFNSMSWLVDQKPQICHDNDRSEITLALIPKERSPSMWSQSMWILSFLSRSHTVLAVDQEQPQRSKDPHCCWWSSISTLLDRVLRFHHSESIVLRSHELFSVIFFNRSISSSDPFISLG